MNEQAAKISVLPPPAPAKAPDDGQGQNDPLVTNERAEGIRKRAGKVLSRFGITFRKGPGRPRLDGTPGAGDEIISQVSPSAPLPGTTVAASLDPSLDTAFIEDCLKAATQGLVDFGNSQLRNAAVRATGGDKEYAKQLVERTNPSDPELARIAKLEAILIKKYGIDVRYLPEFALCFCVIGIGTRYMTAMGELKQFAPVDEGKVIEIKGGKNDS